MYWYIHINNYFAIMSTTAWSNNLTENEESGRMTPDSEERAMFYKGELTEKTGRLELNFSIVRNLVHTHFDTWTNNLTGGQREIYHSRLWKIHGKRVYKNIP